MKRQTIRVQIQRYVDDHVPGFVECLLVDASGQEHFFIEKAPVVSSADLFPDSPYPQPGSIDCEVEKVWTDDTDRQLVLASTHRPWGIESTAGASQFLLFATQVTASAADTQAGY